MRVIDLSDKEVNLAVIKEKFNSAQEIDEQIEKFVVNEDGYKQIVTDMFNDTHFADDVTQDMPQYYYGPSDITYRGIPITK